MAFSYYKVGTIDASQCGTADTANYPVGVIMTDADLRTIANGGFVASASGFDIRPYADAALTTPITYELVFYSPTTGQIELWFAQATLSHTTNGTVYLAFGDATITTDGSGDPWEVNYKLVAHFKDGTTLSVTDSSGTGNNGTDHGATAASGQIDGGVAMVAASAQYVDFGANSSLGITGALTWECWVKCGTSPASFPRIFGREDTSANKGYAVYYGPLPSVFNFRIYTGTGVSDLASVSTLASGTWAYIGGTIDASKNGVIYVNGAQDNTGTFVSLPLDAAFNFFLGARSDLFANRFFDGTVDELRVSSTNRGASYFTATYNNTKTSSTFLTFGAKIATSFVSRLTLLGAG